MNELIQSARRRGYQIARVRIRDKHKDRFVYFIKDSKGRILHNGQSFDLEELTRLFPGSPGASLQSPGNV